jgi:hypothetical protein
MKYIPKSQRPQILKDFQDAIDTIEESLGSAHFLCNILNRRSRVLFIEEKPTPKKHTKFYKSPRFTGDFAWWGLMPDGFTYDCKWERDNKQRVKFIKHLITLVEKQR